ncbi:hypothetical protein BP6252_07667 [Coleophoma cylindrospora]|uniref:SnoaL-like domain-containing protein n=1 Tax=Coleophoma cylindrospora TaxID=1849047 RepID=A0A3D8RB62_9HELO|nr:hypothetical protein BP6252_07667 [Coleophoma cylindrospora]
MSHTYKSALPPSLTPDEGITAFFESFYAISDTPSAHDDYVSFFTPDATLIMASKKGVGASEILEIRKGMWKTVKSRVHYPQKIFPFGAGSREVMLHGLVKYELLDGRKAEG